MCIICKNKILFSKDIIYIITDNSNYFFFIFFLECLYNKLSMTFYLENFYQMSIYKKLTIYLIKYLKL